MKEPYKSLKASNYFWDISKRYELKPFHLSVASHIETRRLICTTNQMTGFHMKNNNGLKWVNFLVTLEQNLNRFYSIYCVISFWSPWKHQKTKVFWHFRGRDQKETLGRKRFNQNLLCWKKNCRVNIYFFVLIGEWFYSE